MPSVDLAFHLTALEVAATSVGLTFTGAMLTLRQKLRNDRLDQWWKRAQWAMDRSFSDDPTQREVGFLACDVLDRQKHVPAADREVVRTAVALGVKALEAARQQELAREVDGDPLPE